MDQLFNIFLFTETDANRIEASPDEAHQHNYEELIIGIEGSLEHFIDFKTTLSDAPFISFVTKGKMHRVIPHIKDDQCKMWVIRFKSEFIPEITFQLYSCYHDHANVPMKRGFCFDRMLALSQMMYDEMQQAIPDLAVTRHLLSALFIMVESERKKLIPVDELIHKTQSETFKNFLSILEENFRRPEGVDYYAEKLFMSARNLNIICQNILQQSVTEIIETRKLIEAKNLLTITDKSISEIGYDLGYNEKAYFTNVFKKKSGQTPTEFREEMKKLLS